MTATTRRLVRRFFGVMFFLVFVDGIAAFSFFMVIRNGAASEPTAAQIAPIQDHGTTYYVTRIEARIYRSLLVVMMVGVPLIVVGFLVLDVVLKIPPVDDGDEGRDAAPRAGP